MNVSVGLIGSGKVASLRASAWRALDAHVIECSANDLAAVEVYGEGESGAPRANPAKIDVVHVAVDLSNRSRVVRAALVAGKDVLCAGQLAATAQEARAIVKQAQNRGLRLYVESLVWEQQEYRTAKRQLDRGLIGNLAVCRFFRQGEVPGRQSVEVLLESAGQDLECARMMVGEVQQVYAAFKQTRASNGNEVGLAHITLSHRNGAISHVCTVTASPGAASSHSFHLAGSNGTLNFDSQHPHSFQICSEMGMSPEQRPQNQHLPGPARYLTDRHDDLPQRFSPEEILEIVDGARLLEAASLSYETHLPVTLETIA